MTAVSSWSLHRTLGQFVADLPAPAEAGGPQPRTASAGAVDLLQLPALLAGRGYDTVQLCHFHLPSRAPDYLAELRRALADHGLTLDALLVDAGDLTHPDSALEHQTWIDGWLDTASQLGARRARVIAGQRPPTPERIASAARRLVELAADHPGIRVVTENWLALLPTAGHVHQLLDRTDDTVGLLVDLGNWRGPDKYADLHSVGGRAETCHAKCHTDPGGRLDTSDYRAALDAILSAGFDGPLALVYDGPDDHEWEHLAAEHLTVSEALAGSRTG